MKVISLNVWGGRINKPLKDFLKNNKDVDVFCLQEVYHDVPLKSIIKHSLYNRYNLYKDISKILHGHQGFFRPHHKRYYGLAIFVKRNITVEKEGDIFIHTVENYQGGGNHSRNLQYVTFKLNNEDITVINLHGLWNGKGKTDTDERIVQSQKIKSFLDSVTGKKILCGDFNLRPDTKSLAMVEDGMVNLVKKYSITSTRTHLYGKPEKFADYIFVTPDISVKDFRVMPDVVSDHSPLFLEI